MCWKRIYEWNKVHHLFLVAPMPTTAFVSVRRHRCGFEEQVTHCVAFINVFPQHSSSSPQRLSLRLLTPALSMLSHSADSVAKPDRSTDHCLAFAQTFNETRLLHESEISSRAVICHSLMTNLLVNVLSLLTFYHDQLPLIY